MTRNGVKLKDAIRSAKTILKNGGSCLNIEAVLCDTCAFTYINGSRECFDITSRIFSLEKWLEEVEPKPQQTEFEF